MTKRLATDVLVVGSGAGGAAVGGAVAAGGRSVLVVEAGPARGWPFGHGRNIDPSEAGLEAFGLLHQAHLVWPSGAAEAPLGLGGAKVVHGLGGMFSLWTNNCPWPHPSELPQWDDPAAWQADLGRAKRLLNVIDDHWHGVRQTALLERVARAVGPLPKGRGVATMSVAGVMESAGLRFTSFVDLLAPGAARDLSVVTELVVRSIFHRGGRATGAVAVDAAGETVEIAAETVVVAAGTIGSAKLLAVGDLETGPALGRGIFDHAAFASRVALTAEIVAAIPPDDGIFTVWVPFSPEHPWHNQLCRFPGLPTPTVPDAPTRETADVFTWIPMDIEPDNRIIFHHGEPDPFGLPSVSGVLRLSADDRKRAARAIGEHYLIAAEIGDLSKGWYPAFYRPGESSHLMGSCRMGPAPDGNSVVDRTGRVWAYDNLYVAGNAVLSTTNGGNPTMVAIAAALRTADTILAGAVPR